MLGDGPRADGLGLEDVRRDDVLEDVALTVVEDGRRGVVHGDANRSALRVGGEAILSTAENLRDHRTARPPFSKWLP
jgi:hypothetical protein